MKRLATGFTGNTLRCTFAGKGENFFCGYKGPKKAHTHKPKTSKGIVVDSKDIIKYVILSTRAANFFLKVNRKEF